MARTTQTQGTPRWNPYTTGEMRKIIKDELDKLSTNDTYRNTKVGTPSFKEAKGRTNWNIYLYGELFEKFTKRFDDTIRGTYTNTLQTMNANSATLNNLSVQLRNLETNVNKYLKTNFENVLTHIVRNAASFDEFKKELMLKSGELGALAEANKTDIRKATKILKDNFVQEITNLKEEYTALKEELSTEQEALKEQLSGIDETVKTHMENFNTTTVNLSDSVKSIMTENGEKMDTTINEFKSTMSGDLDTKIEPLKESAANLNNELTTTKNEVTEMIDEKMSRHQETMNNVIEDQQKLIVAEIQDNLTQQTNLSKDSLESQAEKLAHRMDDMNSTMDEKINNMSESFNQKLQEFHDEYDKTFNREMNEMRTTLSTIRADIEIMKTLLTSIAK